jgi:hypothetical protein
VYQTYVLGIVTDFQVCTAELTVPTSRPTSARAQAMPVSRVHNMLKMVQTGPQAYRGTEQELKLFLDSLVEQVRVHARLLTARRLRSASARVQGILESEGGLYRKVRAGAQRAGQSGT